MTSRHAQTLKFLTFKDGEFEYAGFLCSLLPLPGGRTGIHCQEPCEKSLPSYQASVRLEDSSPPVSLCDYPFLPGKWVMVLSCDLRVGTEFGTSSSSPSV